MPNPAPWQSIPGQKHLVPVKRPRKPLRKVSLKRRKILEKYDELMVRKFRKENPWCAVCSIRKRRRQPTRDCHHIRGRVGKNMLDTTTWLPVCRDCHTYLHRNPKWARERGLLEFRY